MCPICGSEHLFLFGQNYSMFKSNQTVRKLNEKEIDVYQCFINFATFAFCFIRKDTDCIELNSVILDIFTFHICHNNL